jgi:hypothetical protein
MFDFLKISKELHSILASRDTSGRGAVARRAAEQGKFTYVPRGNTNPDCI